MPNANTRSISATTKKKEKKGNKMWQSNYPEGSMRGSGIYSEEVQYDEFICDNCGKENPKGDTATDDWGNYTIDCEFCEHTQTESSLSEDEYDAKADSDYDEWRDERDNRDED